MGSQQAAWRTGWLAEGPVRRLSFRPQWQVGRPPWTERRLARPARGQGEGNCAALGCCAVGVEQRTMLWEGLAK